MNDEWQLWKHSWMANLLQFFPSGGSLFTRRHKGRSSCLETGFWAALLDYPLPLLFLPFQMSVHRNCWCMAHIRSEWGRRLEGQDHSRRHGFGGASKPQRMEVCIPRRPHGKTAAVPVHSCNNHCISLHCSWCCVAARVNEYMHKEAWN